MAASKGFLKALKKNKQNQKRLAKAKEERPSQGYQLPKIDDGQYIARLGAEAAQTENDGTPYVRINFSILEGEFKGKGHSKVYFLDGEDEEKVQGNWDRLSKDIQRIQDYTDDSMEDFGEDIDDFVEEVDTIDEEAPVVKITIKNSTKNGKDYLNVYFDERLDDYEEGEEEEDDDEDEEEEKKPSRKKKSKKSKKVEEEDEDSDDEDEEEEDEGEDEDDEEQDEEEEEDEEDEEEVVISKGDYVEYTPPRSKKPIECVVLTSNKANQTCTLKDEETDKKYSGISWDKVYLLEEEE